VIELPVGEPRRCRHIGSAVSIVDHGRGGDAVRPVFDGGPADHFDAGVFRRRSAGSGWCAGSACGARWEGAGEGDCPAVVFDQRTGAEKGYGNWLQTRGACR